MHLIRSVALKKLKMCDFISVDKLHQCCPVGVHNLSSISFEMNSAMPSCGVHTGVVSVLERNLFVLDS